MNTQEKAVNSVKERGFYAQATLPNATRWPLLMAQTLRMVEEVGELAKAIRKAHAIPGEVADVYITLANVAYLLNIDIEDAVLTKLAADEERGHLHGETRQAPLPINYNAIHPAIRPKDVTPKVCSCGENFTGSDTHCPTCADVIRKAAAAMLDPDTPTGA